MAITQKQIAQALGISRSLVGEALSGHPKVSTETRERVTAMAQQLGYAAGANQEARSLIARRYGQRVKTHAIGLLFERTDTTHHEVGTAVFPGIHQAVRRNNYDVLVIERDRFKDDDLGLALAQDTRCDGFILVNFIEIRGVLETLERANVAAVTCLSNDNPASIPAIMPDNEMAMFQAVEYLVRAGHRAIGHLTGPVEHSDAIARRRGFEKAMQHFGLPSGFGHMVQGHWGRANYDEQSAQALEMDVTAIVCSNDKQALELWDYAERQGKKVGVDISLVGVDDFAAASLRGLTTSNNPLNEVGRVAVESLLGLLNHEPAASLSHIIPMPFQERSSVAFLTPNQR